MDCTVINHRIEEEEAKGEEVSFLLFYFSVIYLFIYIFIFCSLLECIERLKLEEEEEEE